MKCAAEESNDPVFGHITDHNPVNPVNRTQPKKAIGFSASTDYSKMSENKIQCEQIDNKTFDEQRMNKLCPMCGGNHTLFSCDNFKNLSPDKRLDLAREKRLCHNCLVPGHFAYRCYKDTVCTVRGCGRKHTRYLHQTDNNMSAGSSVSDKSTMYPHNGNTNHNEQNTVHTAFSDSAVCSHTGAGIETSKIVLPVVSVKVQAPSERTIETYALLDSGSTNTFCTNELIEELGIQGTNEQLVLTTLEKRNSVVDTRCVSLVISDKEDEHCIELPRVYSRQHLPFDEDCIAKPEDTTAWPHLSNLEVPIVDRSRVLLLIGQDVPDALVPIDVMKGPSGSPYATRTSLGWALNGPVRMMREQLSI